MIPSTDEFEMYPIGLTSIAAYLEANHYNTRLVNLAYRMLRNPHFDVAAHLAKLDAPVFGIDLHWLPHANGALGIAELVKQVHPESKVLIGGLSATYFHEEVIANPAVDFVLRGDSTEEPCRQLLAALRTGSPLDHVENLTWKRLDGQVVVNPLSFVPGDLDWIDVPAYDFMTHAVFKYRSLADFLPYLEWLRYPSTMLLNSRGCTYDCAICGGSRTGYRVVARHTAAALPREIAHGLARLAGRYHTAVTQVGRLHTGAAVQIGTTRHADGTNPDIGVPASSTDALRYARSPAVGHNEDYHDDSSDDTTRIGKDPQT